MSVPLSSTAAQSCDLGYVTSDRQVQCSFVPITVAPETHVVRLTIGSTWLTADGIQTVLDAAPVIQNSRTLIPIRAIVEAFGGTIEWYAELRVVITYLHGHGVNLQIGNWQGYVDGVQKAIDSSDSKVVPIIISGRTFLPLRFVAESLGLQVEWDQASRTVTVQG
ncbi:MAG: copper amine oxidase [Coprothermobacter sp.]|nr:copper amine oxidase [Coprothermobacter sp.]